MDFFTGLSFGLFGSMPHDNVHLCNHPRYFGIQYNHAGSFTLRIDDGPEEELSGPHAFLTRPGHRFEYGPVKEGDSRHHNFLCFYGPRLRAYQEHGLLDFEAGAITVRNGTRFLNKMLEIMSLCPVGTEAPPLAVLRFEELLLILHEEKEHRDTHPPLFRLTELRALADTIRDEPENPRDWHREAARLCVTATHFRRIFKQATGEPPQQYLIRCRLTRAAGLLRNTERTVAEIAEECGFSGIFYFSRLFKEKFMISPLEYRKERHA